MAKLKCPYTFPHRSREAKIAFIDSIGGYRGDSPIYPLSFNVKAHPTNDMRHLWDPYYRDHVTEDVQTDERALEKYKSMFADIIEHNDGWMNEVYTDAIGTAQESIVEDDGMCRMLWDGTVVPVRMGFVGRNGGNLVVVSWNSSIFRGLSSRDLIEELRDRDTVLSTELNLLYKYCRHWAQDLTSANATREIEYLMAYQVFNRVDDLYFEEVVKVEAERARKQGPKLTGRRVIIRGSGTIQ